MANGRELSLPITHTSKPLLAIGDKPILEHILEDLIEQGIQTFWISVNYLGEAIKEHFRMEVVGVSISNIKEDKPRGTAGSLELLPIEKIVFPILVMNGDIIANINLERMIEHLRAPGHRLPSVQSFTTSSSIWRLESDGRACDWSEGKARYKCS